MGFSKTFLFFSLSKPTLRFVVSLPAPSGLNTTDLSLRQTSLLTFLLPPMPSIALEDFTFPFFCKDIWHVMWKFTGLD